MSLFVVPLVLGNKHLQYPMEAIPALPVTLNNCLLVYSNSMSYKNGCHSSPLLQYTTAIPSSILQSINRYRFCILNAYLSSEAMRLKTNITFVARTMETRAPSIVFKAHKRLLARDTCLLADGIINVCTIQREHFAIYGNLGAVNF